MRVSTKADYALRVVLHLAAEAGGGPVAAHTVADRQAIPLASLRHVLAELNRQGLIRSHRSEPRGYSLARPADEMTLADVVTAVEGKVVSVGDNGIDGLEYEGAAAPLLDVWLAVESSVRSILHDSSVADLLGLAGLSAEGAEDGAGVGAAPAVVTPA
ncbi:MAG TPA: Rrf2 family transcriptional regulator [Acidimicrobiales bacterium]|nr:Rrf2 family transcriptional regulator [Acidimicrobiales bacterium]